jgi:predicted glutamine amidotransferase
MVKGEKIMVVEILYPELTNIFGDYANITYLEKCMPKAKFIYTSINKEPYFIKNKVDMIYLGSMSEEYQKIIVEKLTKYKKNLIECIEKDVIVLFTGMATEIIGNYIIENDKKQKCLGLFDVYFERNKTKRHNSLFLGNFEKFKIVGNKSQFTMMYGDNKYPFIEVHDGCVGMNLNFKYEGIHYRNFFATQLLGPLLILNPYFTDYLIKLKNKDFKLEYKKDIIQNYKNRLELLENRKKYII